MATITWAQAALLSQDTLLRGVIETIVKVNPIYEVMPMRPIEGNALAYNRELAMGDSEFLGIGGTITAKNAATVSQATSKLTTIIGDAEINGLIVATQSNINDQRAYQVSSKVKSVAMQFQDGMVNGTGTGDTFAGLLSLTPGSQIIDNSHNDLTYERLDELLDLVKSKNGQVDYILMSMAMRRQYFKLLRKANGNTMDNMATLPSGRRVPAYGDVPIFISDYMPKDAVNVSSPILAGCFDDGSGKLGISGLLARKNFGISIKSIGEKEDMDEEIIRVKLYAGFAVFNELGVAAITNVSEQG